MTGAVDIAAVLPIGALLTNALLAGLFFAFSIAVTPALRRAGDQVFVAVFRDINVVILRPGFLIVFVLSPVMAILAAALGPAASRWALTLAAAAAVLSTAVTVAINVPLNRALHAAAGSTGDVAAGAHAAQAARAARVNFDRPWSRANAIRCAANTAAVLCLGAALLGAARPG